MIMTKPKIINMTILQNQVSTYLSSSMSNHLLFHSFVYLLTHSLTYPLSHQLSSTQCSPLTLVCFWFPDYTTIFPVLGCSHMWFP